ncbi:MAG: glycoside hydrolase family 2 [Clostridia bacterium]|nr:glycoside hydrolase family 2 [Clostridia bacterium]
MLTPFSAQLDKSLPLNDYPRPQLERPHWLNLNGQWDYAILGTDSSVPHDFHGKITVPFAVESELSGVGRALSPIERLWYRRFFTIPSHFGKKNVILHFGAVDWQTDVYLNGSKIGSHTGGYNAFSFDITEYLKKGDNELVVSVTDPTDEGPQQRGKQALRSHGFWYTGTSGIWQTVWLEPVSAEHIDSVSLTPDIDAGIIRVRTRSSGTSDLTLTAQIFDGDREIIKRKITADDAIAVPDAKLWSPETPFLYNMTLTMRSGRRIVDTVRTYFGMRKFSMEVADDGYQRIFLNNKPYFQTGLLDQGYWPDGGMTAPTDEAMIFDISEMKQLGFNMLRKHIKVEPLRWYYHCDRLGMLVWQDMVSGGKALDPITAGAIPNVQGIFSPVANFSMKDDKYVLFHRDKPEWREMFRREMQDTVKELYNVVSICVWVPFNEGWGQFDAVDISEELKETDPSRLIDHASGWYDQGAGDFRSIHRYILPLQIPRQDLNRAFVLSEFGGYSRIVEGHVWNRKKSFGYIMFKDSENLSKAFGKLYEKQIIPAVKKGLAACVYTQVSDVEFEVNGIYTYDRQHLKIDEGVIKSVNKKLKANNR